MLSAVVLLASLHAAPPPSFAIPPLNHSNVSVEETALYAELLGQKLAGLGLKVISSRDVGALLGLERQNQLLGCAESSCVAELAGALGADGLVLGDLGKLDEGYLMNLKVLSSKGGALATFNGQATSARELPSLIAAAARALTRQVGAALERPDLVATAQEPVAAPARRWAVVPLSVGGVALAAGVAGIVVTRLSFDALTGANTVAAAERFSAQGKTWQLATGLLLGVGVVAVATGVLMSFLGPSEVVPTVAVLPGGAAVGLTGVWR